MPLLPAPGLSDVVAISGDALPACPKLVRVCAAAANLAWSRDGIAASFETSIFDTARPNVGLP